MDCRGGIPLETLVSAALPEVGPDYLGPGAGPASFHSAHPGGSNFRCVDGSVCFISDSESPATMRALAVRNRGEVVANDY
jgi:hypothetical protein